MALKIFGQLTPFHSRIHQTGFLYWEFWEQVDFTLSLKFGIFKRVFIPQKLANATNLISGKLVVKHLLTHCQLYPLLEIKNETSEKINLLNRLKVIVMNQLHDINSKFYGKYF